MITPLLTHLMHITAIDCANPHAVFFGFPKWYAYLHSQTIDGPGGPTCAPQITGIGDVWLVVAAVIEMAVRLAALVAFFVMVAASFKFETSQGKPDKTEAARTTLIRAAVGLGIAIVATASITFIAGRFKST